MMYEDARCVFWQDLAVRCIADSRKTHARSQKDAEKHARLSATDDGVQLS